VVIFLLLLLLLHLPSLYLLVLLVLLHTNNNNNMAEFPPLQVVTLSLLAGVIGLPVTSNSLITAALHCCGRLDPKRDVNWMFALRVSHEEEEEQGMAT